MKILFVIPKQANYYGSETTRTRLPHIGIAYLSAYLKKEGHQVYVYDCTIENNDNLFFEDFLQLYDIIGITLYSLNISSSYIFVNKIVAHLKKQGNKKVPVVLGGPHVTVAKKDVLVKTNADFAIKGEGEVTLSELLKNLSNTSSLYEIDGLIWRDGSGRIVENFPRKFIEELDALPFPDYSIFKLEKYMSSELNEIPINTSRGCPFDCLFCAVSLVSGKHFRARKPENVVQEIMVNYKNGIRNFYVVDDAFNLNIKRAEEICNLIIKKNLKIRFVFQNGLRADRLTQALADKLKTAGCTAIVLSAESGNNNVLKAIKKNLTVEKFKAAVNIVDEANIIFIVNFIIGHPTETYNKAMDSIRLANEIKRRRNCATIMFFNLIPYPGTAVFEWVEKNGRWVSPKEKFLDSSMSNTLPIFESDEFTKGERITLLKKGNRLHMETLLRFIFGRYFGFFMQLIIRIGFIRYLSIKFAFSNKIGQRTVYTRFLKKLYHME